MKKLFALVAVALIALSATLSAQELKPDVICLSSRFIVNGGSTFDCIAKVFDEGKQWGGFFFANDIYAKRRSDTTNMGSFGLGAGYRVENLALFFGVGYSLDNKIRYNLGLSFCNDNWYISWFNDIAANDPRYDLKALYYPDFCKVLCPIGVGPFMRKSYELGLIGVMTQIEATRMLRFNFGFGYNNYTKLVNKTLLGFGGVTIAFNEPK